MLAPHPLQPVASAISRDGLTHDGAFHFPFTTLDFQSIVPMYTLCLDVVQNSAHLRNLELPLLKLLKERLEIADVERDTALDLLQEFYGDDVDFLVHKCPQEARNCSSGSSWNPSHCQDLSCRRELFSLYVAVEFYELGLWKCYCPECFLKLHRELTSSANSRVPAGVGKIFHYSKFDFMLAENVLERLAREISSRN